MEPKEPTPKPSVANQTPNNETPNPAPASPPSHGRGRGGGWAGRGRGRGRDTRGIMYTPWQNNNMSVRGPLIQNYVGAACMMGNNHPSYWSADLTYHPPETAPTFTNQHPYGGGQHGQQFQPGPQPYNTQPHLANFRQTQNQSQNQNQNTPPVPTIPTLTLTPQELQLLIFHATDNILHGIQTHSPTLIPEMVTSFTASICTAKGLWFPPESNPLLLPVLLSGHHPATFAAPQCPYVSHDLPQFEPAHLGFGFASSGPTGAYFAGRNGGPQGQVHRQVHRQVHPNVPGHAYAHRSHQQSPPLLHPIPVSAGMVYPLLSPQTYSNYSPAPAPPPLLQPHTSPGSHPSSVPFSTSQLQRSGSAHPAVPKNARKPRVTSQEKWALRQMEKYLVEATWPREATPLEDQNRTTEMLGKLEHLFVGPEGTKDSGGVPNGSADKAVSKGEEDAGLMKALEKQKEKEQERRHFEAAKNRMYLLKREMDAKVQQWERKQTKGQGEKTGEEKTADEETTKEQTGEAK